MSEREKTMAKRMLLLFAALAVVAGTFIGAYSAVVAAADADPDVSGGIDTTDASEGAVSDTSVGDVSGTDESEPGGSSDESGGEDTEPSGDEAVVTDFEDFAQAMADGKTNIRIDGEIVCDVPITVASKVTVSGGTLSKAMFDGDGEIVLSGVGIGILSVGGGVTLTVDGSVGSLNASGSCSVKITGNVGGGARVSSSASVRIEGSVTAASGAGLYASGSGSIAVSGDITGADSGAGIEIASGCTSDVTVGGSVCGGNGGGAGILFGSGFCRISVAGSVRGGDKSDGGRGADYDASGVSGTVELGSPAADSLLLTGSFSFTLAGVKVNGSFQNSEISITANKEDCFTEPDDSFLYQQFKVSGNAQATLIISEPSRAGKVAHVLFFDGSAETELFNGEFTGEYTIEQSTAGIYALYIEEQEFAVITGSGENGRVSPDGVTKVREGGSLTITFKPDSGYVIDTLTVNGEVISGFSGSEYKLENIMAETTVFVTFRKSSEPVTEHTVTIRASTGGTVSPFGEVKVTDGGSLTLELSPESGHYVSRITVDGDSVSFSGKTFTLENITSDRIIAVTFAVETHYSVIVEVGEGGTVTPGTANVVSGGSATFVITPDSGYIIDKVTVDYGTLKGSGGVYTVSRVTRDTIMTVTFKRGEGWDVDMVLEGDVDWNAKPLSIGLLDYTILSPQVLARIVAEHNGESVIAYGNGYEYLFDAGAFEGRSELPLDLGLKLTLGGHEDIAGSNAHFTLTFNESGLPESAVSLSLGASSAGRKYTVYTVSGGVAESMGEHYCDAAGVLTIPYTGVETVIVDNGGEHYTVTVKVEGSGSVSPSGSVSVLPGDTVTFEFTPEDGYRAMKVLLNGVEVEYEGDGRYTLSSVQEDCELTVVFEEAKDVSVLPKVKNTATVVLIVFGAMMILCGAAYMILRKSGIIKFSKEL